MLDKWRDFGELLVTRDGIVIQCPYCSHKVLVLSETGSALGDACPCGAQLRVTVQSRRCVHHNKTNDNAQRRSLDN